jgi:hydroxyacylglutathione hydrolase
MDVQIASFLSEGLGHSSHLVDLGDGTALVIDPARLPTAQIEHAAHAGLTLALTVYTHIHTDYISGSPDLAVADGDVLTVGRYHLKVIATPGHTPDHLAYLLLDDSGPVVLSSGGSLMVGTVGRTDLLGDARREELARDLYEALQDRILTLPDELAVYPTHGAGSFCSAPGGGERTTTIGRERATNPMLTVGSEDEFVDRLLGGFGSFPSYFRRLPTVNQHGVEQHDTVPELTQLDVTDVDRPVDDEGALVVDARNVLDSAAGHVPGSLSIELRPVFVPDDDQDEIDLVRQALTVGHDNLAGRLAGGIGAWTAAGRPMQTVEVLEQGTVDRPLLDIRQADEFTAGHVPGATHIELGALGDIAVKVGPVATMCGMTERAMSGASVLQRAGHDDVAVLRGGFNAWSAIAGNVAESG